MKKYFWIVIISICRRGHLKFLVLKKTSPRNKEISNFFYNGICKFFEEECYSQNIDWQFIELSTVLCIEGSSENSVLAKKLKISLKGKMKRAQ